MLLCKQKFSAADIAYRQHQLHVSLACRHDMLDEDAEEASCLAHDRDALRSGAALVQPTIVTQLQCRSSS